MKSVYSAVRTGPLNRAVCASSLKGYNKAFELNSVEVTGILLQKLKTSKYFKELIFSTLLFANDQFIISDSEDNLEKAVYLLYNISKE